MLNSKILRVVTRAYTVHQHMYTIVVKHNQSGVCDRAPERVLASVWFVSLRLNNVRMESVSKSQGINENNRWEEPGAFPIIS